MLYQQIKKKNKFKFYYSFLLLLIAVSSSCRKNIPPKPVDASFVISEVISYGPYADKFEPYDTDSATSCVVRFTANQVQETGIEYEWNVGTDPTSFNKNSFVVDFCGTPARTINIKLLVRKRNQTDGSIKEEISTTRKLYLKKNTTIYGSYIGKYEGDNNNYVLKIEPNINIPVENEMGIQNYTGILISSNSPKNDTVYLPNDWGGSAIVLLSRSLYLYHFEPIPTIPQVNKTITPRKITSVLNKNNKDIDLLVEGWDPKTHLSKNVHFKGNRI